MEKRKETLTLLKLCRFCLSQDESLTSIYDGTPAPRNSVTLPLKILSSVSVEVFPSDKMPTFICNKCRIFIDICHEYKQMCREADESILKYIQKGTELKTIDWPTTLKKVYNNAIKASPEKAVFETRVKGGATVQVMAQDGSESDDNEDENIYNIKIGDGSDDNSKSDSTCIKLVGNNDQLKITKKQPKRNTKEMGVMKKVDTGEEQQRWACDECDRTYPLQQQLNLHKEQKHRARTERCDHCDIKFFTKGDLAAHMALHTDDTSFECVACDKKFKRLQLLKRHEKMAHSDLLQHKCKNCPASFLCKEELEAHQLKHLRYAGHTVACEVCDKKFHSTVARQRHMDVVHKRELSFACEYCPERFSSRPKLARHVLYHTDDRPFSCKFCKKAFMKSHHLTRHVRLKHRETLRGPRGPFGEPERLRCEQCGDAFATQDELIYHSAIHATQNLICPLCQEKFPDVDEVTAHIKSHVNGAEFTCDYCELVFITQEKLEDHLTLAHEDEFAEQDPMQDEESVEMDVDDEDDEGEINLKEEDDHMIVEIKKPDNYMLNKDVEFDEKVNNTNSEESECEAIYTELATVDPLEMVKQVAVKMAPAPAPAPEGGSVSSTKTLPKAETASILRKAEEIKRKATQQNAGSTSVKNSNTAGASDKSLRLLEKELQDLKRTNSRSEVSKPPPKTVENLRSRRIQVHTSTPKPTSRVVEEKKVQSVQKSAVVEKKLPERRALTKENKEPKEVKEVKGSNGNAKEDKDKETKTTVKNGGTDKASTEEIVRRSTRPSKVKDYAKMSQGNDNDESDEDNDDEEYKETEKTPETRSKPRRGSIKTLPAPKPAPAPAPLPAVAAAAAAATPVRKRGRPRKDQAKETPAKIKKTNDDNEDDEDIDAKSDIIKVDEKHANNKTPTMEITNANKTNLEKRPDDVLVSPSGQTLKKVPVKALPPGVKPLPLPMNARAISSGELCEMQIGKKLVKVQKIVMTKAEVEAMAKKGLVEMKDGTMVLKQGIKLPSTDAAAIKSSLVGDGIKKDVKTESPSKGTPTRCDIGDEE